MPMPIIPAAPFPNVPNSPGVPQLARSSATSAPPNNTLSAQAPNNKLWESTQAEPMWGVFNSAGIRVVTPDSILNFDQHNEFQIPDFMVQNGGFASYNKITLPYEISLRFSKGGSLSDRTAFLNQLNAIIGDTNLYTVVTPEQTYAGVNFIRREVMRRGKGAAFFLDEVDVFFRQIAQIQAQYNTVDQTTANAQNPAAQPATNLGNVSPQTPVPSAAATAAANAVLQAPM